MTGGATGTSRAASLRVDAKRYTKQRGSLLWTTGNPQHRVPHHIKWTSFAPLGWTNFAPPLTNGVPATLVYDGRGFFDTSELFWWVGEGGSPRDPDTNFKIRKNFRDLMAKDPDEVEAIIEDQKEQGRYGAGHIDPETWELWGYSGPETITHQPFFGLTLVSCERGAMRQSPDGILIYGDTEKREIPLGKELRGRGAELMDLYDGVVHGKPIFHDGRWGMATLEVCLAIIDSSRQKSEIRMTRQVPVED